MTRVYKTESGKSVIRSKLLSMFPGANCEGDRSKLNRPTPDLIVIDLLQYIKLIRPAPEESLNQSNVIFDGECTKDYGVAVKYLVGVVDRMVGLSLQGNHRSDWQKEEDEGVSDNFGEEDCQVNEVSKLEPLTVVVAIDKYKYVCSARGVVHAKRKKPRSKPLGSGEFVEPNLQDIVEYPFDQITEDKARNSPVLFRFLARNMLWMLAKKKYNRDVLFVFDGHCFTSDDPYTLFGYSPLEDPSNPYATPFYLKKTFGRRDPVYGWLHSFKNYIGETDFLPYFYLDKFRLVKDLIPKSAGKTIRHMDIYSNDTDTTLYSMIYISGQQEGLEAIDGITVSYERIRQASPPKWLNINSLVEMVESRMKRNGWSEVERPALQLAVASLSVGSDYTEGHGQIPQNHFVESYVENCHIIGNVVKILTDEQDTIYNLKVNGSEYTRFIAMGYVQARGKTKAWSDFDPYKFERKSLYRGVRKQLIKCYPLSDKFWLPSNEDIMLSAKQMQYYANMLGRLGERTVDIELQDSNLEVYGYTKKRHEDTDQEMTVRAIHTYTEREIERETQEVLGLKAFEAAKKKHQKSLAAAAKRKASAKEGNNGGPTKKRKVGRQEKVVEYYEGIDLSDVEGNDD